MVSRKSWRLYFSITDVRSSQTVFKNYFKIFFCCGKIYVPRTLPLESVLSLCFCGLKHFTRLCSRHHHPPPPTSGAFRLRKRNLCPLNSNSRPPPRPAPPALLWPLLCFLSLCVWRFQGPFLSAERLCTFVGDSWPHTCGSIPALSSFSLLSLFIYFLQHHSVSISVTLR